MDKCVKKTAKWRPKFRKKRRKPRKGDGMLPADFKSGTGKAKPRI